jgi:starch synthase (maltosyl-transferring)
MKDAPPVQRRVPAPQPDVVVERVEPAVDGGRFAAKAAVHDRFVVSADVFSHGHDLVRAVVRYRRPGARRWRESPMAHAGNDRFVAALVPDTEGPLDVEIAGAHDTLSTWARDARRRLEAGRPDPFDSETGAKLLAEAADGLQLAAAALSPAARDNTGASERAMEIADGATAARALAGRLAGALDLQVLAEIDALSIALASRPIPAASSETTSRFKVFVDRPKAAFSTWYELFPRSASPDPRRPGRLTDVIDRLDYVADLGFDVLYLPPIHPIGQTARKGRNNQPSADPSDVGSPWAIGSSLGGHDAIDPELGTFDDFARLLEEASRIGIDVALDLAFQCSPDHPWVSEHPEWFRHRPDGTIACAENPPKRYEDIYPLDFSSTDREGLWRALYGVTKGWVDRGVRIFRVDNPHTKPFAFWEWLIAEIKRDHPGVVFLSEAFTRPKVMHRLAKLGFDQSYTYFTWRYEKWELTEYFEELAHGEGRSYFRPNVWPNTPDILAKSLQQPGHGAFIARLVLAGGLSANYGIYGPVFELMWNTPVSPGSEEYLSSEKYEVHHHDLNDPRSLREIVARLNFARRGHPALQRDSSLRFCPVDNDKIIAWRKSDASGTDVVIGVVNLDPIWTQMGRIDLDLSDLGIAPGATFAVHDVLGGETYEWQAGYNFVKLDPAGIPAHLFVLDRSA